MADEVRRQFLSRSPLLAELVPVVSFARRRWPLALGMCVLSVATTLGLLCVRGVEYQVSAALFYKLGPELSPPPTMSKEPLMITRRTEDVNNEIEILTSPHLLHQVVEELGEGFFRAPPPATQWERLKGRVMQVVQVIPNAIEEAMIRAGLRRRLTLLEKVETVIASRLNVELVRNSDVISVTLNFPSPEAGVIILQKLLDAYQVHHLAVHQEVAVKDFFSRQTDDLRRQLAESTNRLLEFQTRVDLWSAEEQQKLLLDSRKLHTMQVASTSARVAQLEAVVGGLSSSLAELPDTVELNRTEQLNPAIIDLEDRIASLDLGLAVTQTAYLPDARETQDRRQQLQIMREKAAGQPGLVLHSTTRGVNLTRQELVKEHLLRSAELNGARDQLEAEQGQLAAVNRELQEMGAAIAEYRQMEREHRMLDQKYALYSESLQKADIAEVMNLSKISNMELISPPTASKVPNRAGLTMALAGSVLAGLALTVGLGVLLDLRSVWRSEVSEVRSAS